jgi:diguanylate cyclase (GGDEF)-like protein
MQTPSIASDAGALRDGDFIDCLPHLVLIRARQTSLYSGNRAWCSYTSSQRADGFGIEWLDHVHPEDRLRVLSCWDRAGQHQDATQRGCRIRRGDGNYRWFAINAGALAATEATFLTFTEITDHVISYQQLEAKANSQTSMLDASVDCIKLIRPDGELMLMNRSGCLALGFSPDCREFGMKWLDRLPMEVRKRGRRALSEAGNGNSARFPGMSILPGEKPQFWDNLLTPVISPDGQTGAILCVSRNVTLQRLAERRLRYASEVDSLTGLWNRRVFRKRLKHFIVKARQTGQQIGLLLIDLDHFKHVNDTLGHPAGDHLLRVLSKRLKTCVPPRAVVARLGGDEFAIVLPDIAAESELRGVAQDVLARGRSPVSYSGKTINGGMSIGCAVYPRDGDDSSSLMKHADTALNDLKSSGGRGGVRFFSTQMLEQMMLAASQLRNAREIIEQDRIVPCYQPKVRLDTRAVAGFEALMRWRQNDHTLGLPASVAEAFNDYELATGIADAMHSKVLADMAGWLQSGASVLPVSINASPVEFFRDDYAERLLSKLSRFGIPANFIEVEITENMLLARGADFTARALNVMKKAGVRIALDDFGTGHSSFSHLRDYPVDVLKIDREFVAGMTHDPAIRAITETACFLGKRLSLDVVAEGIENETHAVVLQQAGCSFGQGVYFGAPLPAIEAASLFGRATFAASGKLHDVRPIPALP